MKDQTVYNENKTYPQAIIARTKILEGRYINAIIKNGLYYFIDLPVYEDGVVSCWELVDLELLKTKISRGWLTPNVPDNEMIVTHHLGSWEIESSNWYYNKNNYFDFILSVVKTMNPSLSNLFQSNGQTSKVIGNTKSSVFSNSPYQLIRKDHATNVSSKEYKGEREHYLYKKADGIYWLCSLNIYADGSILIDGIDNPVKTDKQRLEHLIENGTITTRIPDHSTILIMDLGEIKIAKTVYYIDVKEKFAAIDDIINRLNNKPTTSDECLKIFEKYNNNPTKENKEKLKVAYEKIPKHLREYVLGEPNERDWPIREIIYEDE